MVVDSAFDVAALHLEICGTHTVPLVSHPAVDGRVCPECLEDYVGSLIKDGEVWNGDEWITQDK